jgi:hypothetical protein
MAGDDGATTPVPKQVKRCKCGSTTHQRTNHGDCRLNKGPRQAKLTTTPTTTVDAAMRAEIARATEWTFEPVPDEYELQYDTNILDEFFRARFSKELKYIQEKTKTMNRNNHEDHGVEDEKQAALLNIFLALSKGIFHTAFDYAKKKSNSRASQREDDGVNAKVERIKDWELYSFLSIFFFSDQMNYSLDFALQTMEMNSRCEQMMAAALGPTQGSPVLSKERYLEIMRLLTVEDPDKMENNETKCYSSIDTIGSDSMRQFEELAYGTGMAMFVSQYTIGVLDDEFIGALSQTVESFMTSARKADGKGGFKNDATASSFLRNFISVRHKERLNYSQMQTVEILFTQIKDHVKNLGTDSKPLFTADRGYSKLALWRLLATLDFDFLMIANKGAKVGHPFLFSSELARKAERAAARKLKKAAQKVVAEQQNPDEGNDVGSVVAGQQNPDEGIDVEKVVAEQQNPEEGSAGEATSDEESENEEETEVPTIQNIQPAEVQGDQPTEVQGDEIREELDLDCIFEEEGEISDIIENRPRGTAFIQGDRPSHVIDDDLDFGKEIYSATCTIETSEGEERTLVASAFRDYRKRNANNTNGLRFIWSVSDAHIGQIADKIRNTIGMERMSLPRSVNKAKEVLFHPGRRTDERKRMEDDLRANTTPLTAWQRSADWFICRQFLVTGTAAQKIANLDKNARRLLLKEPRRIQEQEISDEDVADALYDSWVYKSFQGTSAMETGTMNERGVFLSEESKLVLRDLRGWLACLKKIHVSWCLC